MAILKHRERIVIPALALLVILLSGCTNPLACLFGCVSRPSPVAPLIQPINTTLLPHVTVVYEVDGPPLQPAKYAVTALHMLADRIDNAIIPGESGLDVFIGAITSHSLQNALLAFSVPAIPPDKPKPVLQICPTEAAENETPTHFADRVAACQTANSQAMADWQAFLTTNHQLLNQVKAQVKIDTNALRNLKPVFDPVSDDIFGGLSDASAHFAHFQSGIKILTLVSPMDNNTNIDQTQEIRLSGVKVNVTFFTCQLARECDQKKAYWTQQLLHFGASSVAFYNPQDTIVENPTF